MPRNAVTSTITGAVKRWGDLDFSSTIGANEVQVSLRDGAVPHPESEPLHHFTVTRGGAFAKLSAPQRQAADAELAAEQQAAAVGAKQIGRVVGSPGDLPLPPPAAGLLVGLVDGGGGIPAIALSEATRWAIFDADRFHGP